MQSADVIDVPRELGLFVIRCALYLVGAWAVKGYKVVGAFFIDHSIDFLST